MTAPSDDPTAGMEPIRQIAMEMMRRCGTCRTWKPWAGWAGWGACVWSESHMPASLRAAPDMHEDAGTDCAMWKDRADGV